MRVIWWWCLLLLCYNSLFWCLVLDNSSTAACNSSRTALDLQKESKITDQQAAKWGMLSWYQPHTPNSITHPYNSHFQLFRNVFFLINLEENQENISYLSRMVWLTIRKIIKFETNGTKLHQPRWIVMNSTTPINQKRSFFLLPAYLGSRRQFQHPYLVI